MNNVNLEHINLTVTDPDASARLLSDLFGWHVRWAGDAMNNGRTVHVGTQQSYLALYTSDNLRSRKRQANDIANINHVAVVVDNLDDIEDKVKASNLQPFNHGDYEPGKRFYFMMDDDIEIEVVSYG